MSLSPLSLAALSTAAASTARVAVETLGQASESFASIFAAQASDQGIEQSTPQSASMSEQLAAWSDKFRDWLSSNGISMPFGIKLNVDEFGYSQLEVSGEQQAKIEALLEAEPAWRQQLERFAATAQAAAFQLFTSPVELQVSQTESGMKFV